MRFSGIALRFGLVALAGVLAAQQQDTSAGAEDQTWRDKPVSQWSADDAQQVLTNSPWSKTTVPEIERQNRGGGNPGMRRGGMGGMGGMGGGIGGLGRGGLGYPGGGGNGGWGGNGGGQRRQDPDQDSDNSGNGSGRNAPRNLVVRWESALPVQDANLKAKISDAPHVDEDEYAIAVIGVPNRIANDSSASKPKAELKRDGQKTIKQSAARVIARDDGTMVLFTFPRSKEITAKDKRVDFEAQVGRMKVHQTFYLADMQYQNKLAL